MCMMRASSVTSERAATDADCKPCNYTCLRLAKLVQQLATCVYSLYVFRVNSKWPQDLCTWCNALLAAALTYPVSATLVYLVPAQIQGQV
jgi:hypothetical protein